MPLENEMKNPRSFMKPCGVLNIAMGVIVTMYAALGFFGYIRYGSEIAGSITLNLPTQESLGIAVQLLLAIAIFFTHPIQCYVAINISWDEYLSPLLEKYRYKLFWEYVVRTAIILVTCKYICRFGFISDSRDDNAMWKRASPLNESHHPFNKHYSYIIYVYYISITILINAVLYEKKI